MQGLYKNNNNNNNNNNKIISLLFYITTTTVIYVLSTDRCFHSPYQCNKKFGMKNLIFFTRIVVTSPSGWGLVIPIFFFRFFFILVKQIFVANFRYTTRTRILSNRSILCTLRGGRTTAGSNDPGAFLVLNVKTITNQLWYLYLSFVTQLSLSLPVVSKE